MNKTGHIYAITNDINGKVYIGASTNVKRRLTGHKSNLKYDRHDNKHLQNSVNKYGLENFKFEPLFEVPINELNINENFYINFFDSMNPEKGFNKQEGGKSGYKVSDETRKKMRENSARYWKGKTLSEEHKRKLSEVKKGKNNHMYGKHHTEEARKKISEANKGRKLSEEARKKISEALNTTGYYRVIKTKNKECKQGFYWCYKYYDENGKRKTINSIDINKLEEKVKARGLDWYIL